jgi:hypothetical protein
MQKAYLQIGIMQKRSRKQYLSLGIGHSGTGAPLPIFIVISLGRMRLFNFPI